MGSGWNSMLLLPRARTKIPQALRCCQKNRKIYVIVGFFFFLSNSVYFCVYKLEKHIHEHETIREYRIQATLCGIMCSQ